MTRLARRLVLQSVVGALGGVALTACARSNTDSSSPAPLRSAIDTMTFAPFLDVDVSKFTKTRAGSYYRDLVQGSGAVAGLNRTLTVKYAISLPDGTVVEAQRTPAEIVLDDKVIRGWRDAIPGMRAGGSRVIILPPELAYGRAGYAGVPPRATLVFVIELIAVH
jgi:FKBP-type peptidyl-prolyl cis-trans isomerase FkpA